MKEALKIFIPMAAIIVTAFLLYKQIRDNDLSIRRELINQKESLIREDSIRQLKVDVLLDSLDKISNRLEEERLLQRSENVKLRKQNEKLEKLYRSIDLSDRPNY